MWPSFGVIIGGNAGVSCGFIDGGGGNSRKVEVPGRSINTRCAEVRIARINLITSTRVSFFVVLKTSWPFFRSSLPFIFVMSFA